MGSAQTIMPTRLLAPLCLFALLSLARASPTPVDPAEIVPEDAAREAPAALTQTGWPWSSCSKSKYGSREMKKAKWGLFQPAGPHRCIPTDYMKISCPVVRALAGSGFLEFDSSSPAGQYITSAKALLKTMTDVLGFVSTEDFATDAAKPFKGINTAENAQGVKQVNNDKIDLLAMQNFLNHAASTGILGSATHAGRRLLGGSLPDAMYNKARLDKLKAEAKTGDFTPAEFGSAVNMFAGERYHNRNNHQVFRVDLTWAKNPYSWAILTLEFSNTLAAFKRSRFNFPHNAFWFGRRNEDISVTAVNDIWENGHLPAGFVPGKNRITMQNLIDTVKAMKIKMPQAVVNTMTSNSATKLDGPRMLTRRLCGGNDWPNCK